MSYPIPCSYLALISAPFFFLIGDAWANQAIWSVHSHSKARLILANNEVSESGNLHFGVHITLEKNWKTYWRNPGNSGVPPEFDWSGSENIEQIRLFWPAPKRITTGPSDFYGYDTEVVFPVEVRPIKSTKAVNIKLHLDYALCKELCIPQSAMLTLNIPPRDMGVHLTNESYNTLLKQYISRIPSPTPSSLSIDMKPPYGQQNGSFLNLEISSKVAFRRPDVFIEGPPKLYFGRPEVIMQNDKKHALLLVPFEISGSTPKGFLLHKITVVDGDRAIERDVKLRYE